jgi:hypothetical protein
VEPVPPVTPRVVWVTPERRRRLAGTVERVRTDEKHRFESAEARLQLVAALTLAAGEETDTTGVGGTGGEP